MGNTYTVVVRGQFTEGSDAYSNRDAWRGESLIVALYALWKAQRAFPYAALEVRNFNI